MNTMRNTTNTFGLDQSSGFLRGKLVLVLILMMFFIRIFFIYCFIYWNRYVRDQENPLEVLSNVEFKRRFRFKKETVAQVLSFGVFCLFIIKITNYYQDWWIQKAFTPPFTLFINMCCRFWFPWSCPMMITWICRDMTWVHSVPRGQWQPEISLLIHILPPNKYRYISHFVLSSCSSFIYSWSIS